MTVNAQLHSRTAVRYLFEMAEGNGGSVVLLAAGEGPYYAGLQRGGAHTLLEAVLSLLGPDHYEEILLATGEGEHLPDLPVTNSDACSRQRLIWLFKSKDQPASAPPAGGNNLLGSLSDEAGKPAKYRVVCHSHREKWPEQMMDLVNQVKRRLASDGPRGLIVIDDQFLMPRTGTAVDHPQGSNFHNIQRDFGKLPELCRDSRVDVVVTCRNRAIANAIAESKSEGPIALQIAADAGTSPNLVERVRMEARQFPKLVWPNATIVELESMEPTSWNEGWLPQADARRSFYDILRRSPPIARQDPLSALDKFVGLEKVREDLMRLQNLLRLEKEHGIRKLDVQPVGLHVALFGHPGTGKTEVAKAIAHIYRQLGVLTGPFIHCSATADLVAGHVGQTAIKTREKIDAAMGGVLFIDEAYGLADDKTFGKDAVNELLKFMTEDKGKLAVFVAGYPEPMKDFLRMNAGLASRFTHQINMPVYTDDQLVEILVVQARRTGKSVADAARPIILKKLAAHRGNCVAARLPFGFARDADNLMVKAKMAQADRLGRRAVRSISNDELSALTADDFSAAELNLPQGEHSAAGA